MFVQALRLSLAMRALNQAKGVAEVQTTIKTGEVTGTLPLMLTAHQYLQVPM